MRPIKGKIIKLTFEFVIVTLTTWVAYLLYFRGSIAQVSIAIPQALWFAAVYSVIGAAFGTHRTLWRYTSLEDLMQVVQACVCAMVAFAVLQHFFAPDYIYNPAFALTHGLVLMAALLGHRTLRRAVHEGLFLPRAQRAAGDPSQSLILVGASRAAERFIKAVKANPASGYEIVGIVDNRRTLFGETVHGVPLLGKAKHLEAILTDLAGKGKKPNRLVFTQTLEGTKSVDPMGVPDHILNKPDQFGLKLSRLPSLLTFHDGVEGPETLSLNPVAIEDLLGRAQAEIDLKAIEALIRGKRVLITGAGGSIGGELSRQVAKCGPSDLTLVDFSEYNLYVLEQDLKDAQIDVPYRCLLANVRVCEQMRHIIGTARPDIVFHAAALKHVPMVELNPSEGVMTNVIGTRIVADACLEFGVAAMVQISTDKAVNPWNVMGATKRLGEYYAQALDLMSGTTRFITVRFGNVMGSSGSVVPLFRRQLERGGPLTVTHPDITRYFMTIREAVSLVLQASAHVISHQSERGRILVLDMGDPIKILDVAHQMITLAGLRPDIDIAITFTGLRPGEKMYEELFDSSEERVETDMPAILAATPRPIDIEVLKRAVHTLEEAAKKGDDMAVRQVLAAVVPGYQADQAQGMSLPLSESRKKA